MQPISKKPLAFETLLITVCTTELGNKKFYVLPTKCVYVFCMDFRINSDYFPVQNLPIASCNRDGVCVLRGTN